MTGTAADSVRLSAVFRDVRVDECYDVGANGGTHDIGDGKGGGCVGGHVGFKGLHGDEGSCCGCGHCEMGVRDGGGTRTRVFVWVLS